MIIKDGNKSSFKAYRCVLLVGFVGYYLMGAKVFQALETDIQEELKTSLLVAKEALMSNYASITPGELEVFLQKLTFSVKCGIVLVLNETTSIRWDFKYSFICGINIKHNRLWVNYSQNAYGPDILYRLCVIGDSSIILLQFLGNVISQPFSGLGKYLQNKGMKGANPSWNYSQTYPALILLWCTFGLTWIALIFNLLSNLLEKTRRKLSLSCDISNKKDIAY